MPQAVVQIELRLLLRSRQMGDFPQAGRMVPDYERDNIRELIEGNYRLIYRIKTEQVDVVTVMLTAQLLPSDFQGIEHRRR